MHIFKKISVICSLLLVFSLGGCKPKESNDNGAQISYEKYNTLLSKDFDSFTLKVSANVDGDVLNGQYTVTALETGKKITYSYQQINEIQEENGEYIFPDEYKSTFSGEMVVDGNVILSQNGAPLNLPFEKISSIGLEFKAEFFENATQTDKSFSADVVNPSGYLGRTLKCSQMLTTVRFIGDTLIKIELSYLSENGASIYIEYSF